MKDRIPSLDGIRAIAIGSVLLLHLNQRLGLPDWFPDGVGLFFVLSGYLITRLLLREQQTTGSVSLVEFYIRRVFRIAPPLYAYLLFILVYAFFNGIALTAHDLEAPALFVQNLAAHHADKASALVEHTWSLAVEEQFYILWPVLLLVTYRLGGRRAALWLALSTILLAPCFRMGSALLHLGFTRHRELFLLPGRMDELGAGCFMALAEGSYTFERFYSRIARFWWVAAAGFCILTPLLLRENIHAYVALGSTLDASFMSLFILWTTRNPETVVGKVLNNPVMVQIGVLSYSVYLWQTFFLHADTGVKVLNTLPLAFLLIPVAAYLSRCLVEIPSIAARDKVIAWYRARNLPAVVPGLALETAQEG